MAFKIYYCHFEYQIMLFELIKIPIMFESYINKILIEKFDIFVIIYLNNIIIYIESKGKKYVKTV